MHKIFACITEFIVIADSLLGMNAFLCYVRIRGMMYKVLFLH